MDYSFQHGFIAFLMSFGTAIAFLLAFKFAYAMATPQKEWDLIKNQKNTAASIGFAGAIIGFALALASAANGSAGLLDFAKWGAVALVAQLLTFWIVRLFLIRDIQKRLEENEISAGVILGATSIAVGLLNAACMSY